MGSLLATLPSTERAKLKKAPAPRSVEPMKAKLTERRFSDPDWIFERKLDGIRCTAFRTKDRVRLVSRSGEGLNRSYPELVDALEAEEVQDFVADGEIVAFEGSTTSFARLQRRMQIRDPERARRSGVAVYLYLFDLTYLDGYELTGLPLRTRKRLLRSALSFRGHVRYTPHRNRDGEAYYRHACERGWEGLIAKRAASLYSRTRSDDWLKLKCHNEQELVIGGYTEPRGSRKRFGALLVGHYSDGRLLYAGKVGTGFDDETLERLGERMARLERDASPFAGGDTPRRAHWIKPELVAQIAFTEWTRDGRLRHPRFLGLRRDKRPSEVTRERPAE